MNILQTACRDMQGEDPRRSEARCHRKRHEITSSDYDEYPSGLYYSSISLGCYILWP